MMYRSIFHSRRRSSFGSKKTSGFPYLRGAALSAIVLFVGATIAKLDEVNLLIRRDMPPLRRLLRRLLVNLLVLMPIVMSHHDLLFHTRTHGVVSVLCVKSSVCSVAV
jgi:hypothetical protein